MSDVHFMHAYDETLDVMQFADDFGFLRYQTESLLRSLQLSLINFCRNEPSKFKWPNL